MSDGRSDHFREIWSNKTNKNENNMKLLYFSAPWCGPCRMFGPVMERLSSEGSINMQKVNIDEEHELVAKFGIRSVPTVVKVDNNGDKVDMFVGVKDANFVTQFYNE